MRGGANLRCLLILCPYYFTIDIFLCKKKLATTFYTPESNLNVISEKII